MFFAMFYYVTYFLVLQKRICLVMWGTIEFYYCSVTCISSVAFIMNKQQSSVKPFCDSYWLLSNCWLRICNQVCVYCSVMIIWLIFSRYHRPKLHPEVDKIDIWWYKPKILLYASLFICVAITSKYHMYTIYRSRGVNNLWRVNNGYRNLSFTNGKCFVGSSFRYHTFYLITE